MDSKQKQLEIAERLQEKILKRFEDLLDTGELSPTDAATLVRLLSQNGWNIDPAALPKGLGDKLTKAVSFAEEDDEVIPIRRTGG